MEYKLLEKELKKAELAKARKGEARLNEEFAWKKRAEKWVASEKALLGEKRALSGEIFTWAKEFARSPEYKRARGFLERDLEIFSGEWGHELSQFSGWSEINLVPDGTLVYEYGHKWVCRSFAIASPEELAKKLSYAYLKELHAFVHSDKVWRRIGVELDFKAKLA